MIGPMRGAAFFIILAIAAPTGAMAQTRRDLVNAAHAFDDSALRLDDNNAKPANVRKWTSPIKVAFTNPGRGSSLVEPARRALRQIAEQANIAVVDVEPNDVSVNFTVTFDENESAQGKRNCFTRIWWHGNSAVYRGELKINPASSNLDNCIIHETLHAFGFISHPHSADSVLSYVYKRPTLTPLDVNLIRTLYDPRLTLGMKPAPASQLACRLLGERMKAAQADIDAVCADRKGPVPAT